ncbi:MAG: DUF4870 domain-containing protein [Lysobacteraceae bacterium]|nr:MAG: DUF4870 domain-containing protein [Xanthomonadaceae bacterium]
MNDSIHSDLDVDGVSTRVPDHAVKAGLSDSDRQWAAAAHLAALVAALATSWFAGIAAAVAALVVWLIVRDKSGFAAAHAKEALNFNLSMFIYAVASVLLVVFTLGIGLLVALPLWIVLALGWVVLTVVAAFKAFDGQEYRFPMTIRLF